MWSCMSSQTSKIQKHFCVFFFSQHKEKGKMFPSLATINIDCGYYNAANEGPNWGIPCRKIANHFVEMDKTYWERVHFLGEFWIEHFFWWKIVKFFDGKCEKIWVRIQTFFFWIGQFLGGIYDTFLANK